MKTLDPRNYKFDNFYQDNHSPFAFMQNNNVLGKGVEEVKFDEKYFDKLDYYKNKVNFGFYGSGNIAEHAAMLLEDNRVLFCIVRGNRFTDTFHSAEEIHMEYYICTPI